MIPGRKILVDDVRIRGIGRTHVHMEQTIPRASGEPVSDMVGVCFLCQVFTSPSQQSIGTIKWYQFIRNDDVRRLTKQPKLTAIIQSRRLTLFIYLYSP